MRTFRIQPTDFLPAVLDLVAAKRGREFGTRWIKKKKKKREREIRKCGKGLEDPPPAQQRPMTSIEITQPLIASLRYFLAIFTTVQFQYETFNETDRRR